MLSRRLGSLAFASATILFVGILATIVIAFDTVVRDQEGSLRALVQTRAQLLAESAVRSPQQASKDLSEDKAVERSLRQAMGRHAFLWPMGTFVVAVRRQHGILLLIQKGTGTEGPEASSLPADSPLGVPMRLALNDRKSGTVRGPDHLGVQVLAAYTHVPQLDIGLVAKLDMADVRRPFLTAFVASTAMSAVLLLLGYLLIRRLGSPLIAELRDNESRFRTIYETVPVSIWEEDLQSIRDMFARLRAGGVEDLEAYLAVHPEVVQELAHRLRVVDVNPATVRMYGAQSSQEFIGSLGSLLTESSLASFAQLLSQLWSGVREFMLEAQQMTLDGRLIHVVLQARLPAFDSGDHRVFMCVTDVTEKVLAQRALQESEALFRAMFESAQLGLAVLSAECRFLRLNRTAQSLLGYSLAELADVTWNELTHPEDQAADALEFAKVASGQQEGFLLEKRLLKRDGNVIHVLLTVAALRRRDGSIEQFVASLTDVGKLRAAIEDATLHAAALEISNRDLQRFAYVASHDLQEPLRGVSGCVQLLGEKYRGQLGAEADELIEHAVSGIERMRRMIQGLLSYSRIATRGDPFVRCDLNLVVADACANLSEEFAASGADIAMEDLPVVRADAGQMLQLFQNLIGNGLRFRRNDGPAHLRIGCLDQGFEWKLWVEDNGIGIAPAYHEAVFEMFRRLHAPDQYPGSGIGLALCKRIVERHGGRIGLVSQLGEGTTVFFTLAKWPADSPNVIS